MIIEVKADGYTEAEQYYDSPGGEDVSQCECCRNYYKEIRKTYLVNQ